MIVTIQYEGAVAVSASDATNDAKGPFAAFFTGVGGDIKVHTVHGEDVVFKSTPAGVIVPVPITRVWLTGTAATNVLGFYGETYRGPVATS